MVNRTVVSSALKFGFETEEEKNSQPVIETKTISNRTARGLKAKYKQAGKSPRPVAMGFSTRPDCINLICYYPSSKTLVDFNF